MTWMSDVCVFCCCSLLSTLSSLFDLVVAMSVAMMIHYFTCFNIILLSLIKLWVFLII
jgi:hypothetical protein